MITTHDYSHDIKEALRSAFGSPRMHDDDAADIRREELRMRRLKHDCIDPDPTCGCVLCEPEAYTLDHFMGDPVAEIGDVIASVRPPRAGEVTE